MHFWKKPALVGIVVAASLTFACGVAVPAARAAETAPQPSDDEHGALAPLQSANLKIFPDSSIVTRDRISVEVVGHGPDVIFVPDLMSSREVWKRIASRLRDHYRLHLVQVAGFAGEPARSNATGPLLELTSEDILTYISNAKLSPVLYVGHALGGAMGLYIAEKQPAYIERMLLIDTVPFFGATIDGPELNPSQAQYLGKLTLDGLLKSKPDEYTAKIKSAIEKMVRDPRAREDVLRWGQKSDRRVVATMMAESVILDLRPHLSNILFPVTIVVPTESDSKDSKEKALVLNKKLYSNLQGAGLNLAIVPHSGHFVMIDQPARLDVILDKFVGLAP